MLKLNRSFLRNDLRNILANRFGSQTGFNTESNRVIVEFARYSPDLVVELVYGQDVLWVGYT